MMNAMNIAVSALSAATNVAAVNANNVANSNTPSFKAKMATLSDFAGGGVGLSSIRLTDTYAPLIPTNNPNDFAVISGYNDPRDLASFYSSAYARFRTDDLGNLVSPSGDILFTGAGGNVRLDNSGNLYKDGSLIGQITPANNQGYQPAGETILQGFMVGSNTNLVSEMLTSITNLRYFQANISTVKTSDEMLGTLINLKG